MIITKSRKKIIIAFVLVLAIILSIGVVFNSGEKVKAETIAREIANWRYQGSDYWSQVYLKMDVEALQYGTASDGIKIIKKTTDFRIFAECTGVDDGAFWPKYKYNISISLKRHGADNATTKNMNWEGGRKDTDGRSENFFGVGDVARDGRYTLSWNGTAAVNATINLNGSFDFYVDTTAPVLTGVTNGAYVNHDVTITADDANFNKLSYSYNYGNAEETQEKSVTISKGRGDGTYSFNAYDVASKSAYIHFVLDTKKPTLTKEVGNSSYTNRLITVTADDTNHKALFYKAPNNATWQETSDKSCTISAINGEWQFYAVDKAGNISDTYTFTYDGVAPVIGLRRADGTSFLDGAWVNQGVYFDVNDLHKQSTKLYKQVNGAWVEINSDYIVGSVYFDIRKPNVLYGSRGMAENAVNMEELARVKSKENWKTTVGDIRIIPPDQQDYVLEGADYWEYTLSTGEIYVYFNHKDLTAFVSSKAKAYIGNSNRDMFFDEGYFKVVATDLGGNESSKTFHIDVVAPTYNINVANGYTNDTIIYAANDTKNSFTTSWRLEDGEWQYLSVNAKELRINSTNGDGVYYIRSIDEAGNINSVSFVLDTQKPTIATAVGNNGYTNKTHTISANDGNFAELFAKQPNGSFESVTKQIAYSSAINGEWQFYAVDKAGNISDTYTFIFDNIKPTGQAVANTTVLGTYYNANFEILGYDNTIVEKIEYKAPGSDWTAYAGAISAIEGLYQYRIIDKAANISNAYVIEIDLTAPTATITKNSNAVDTGVWLNSNDAIKVIINDKNSAHFEIDGAKIDTIDIGSLADGEHSIFVYDKAGNKSSRFIIKIDKVLPELMAKRTNEESLGGSGQTLFANTDVAMIAKDSNFDTIYARINNGEYIAYSVAQFDILAEEINFGTWQVYAVDKAGNKSDTITLTMQIIDDFGNQHKIYNRYKLAAWYEVTLPSYIFDTGVDLPKIAGKYSFENEQDAYAWALRMEEQYRVRQQGDTWIYVTATSEGVAQVYTDRADLDKVLAKYAKRYLSDRKTISASGNDNYYIIKDVFGSTSESAFTRQDIKVPGILQEYAALSIMHARADYKFVVSPKALSSTFLTLTYLSDGFMLANQQEYQISYFDTIQNSLEKQNAYKQGYYLAQEYDMCGNLQSFLVFIDLETPGLNVTVENGDGTLKDVTINKDNVEANAGVYYYLTFNIVEIIDNIDTLMAIKIVGRGINATYVTGDSYPIIGFELGGGQYTITVYDRSSNALSLILNIAGKPCSMEYNSLKPTNKQLTLTFRTNDYLNQIVGLEIYKINGAGESLKLEQDSFGKAIDFTSLEYDFTVGGKYFAVIKDRYGRTTTTAPIFYERGLPVGSLSTTNGAVTNKNVTFKFLQGTAVTVYTIEDNGALKLFNNYLLTFDSLDKMYTLTFEATLENNYNYLIYLYSELDDNLFMEYTFGIDTIIADIAVVDKDGANIERGGATIKPFALRWTEEGVRIKYSMGSDTSTKMYNNGDMLIGTGLYTFIVADRFGNQDTFTVYLDNIVEYTLTGDGKIINTKEKYVSNMPMTLTVTEVFTRFVVESSNGKIFASGYPITHEGLYKVTIDDRYGNTITIVLELDMTAPSVELNVTDGATTLSDVTVTFDDDVRGFLLKNDVVIREIYSGEIFTAHGVYSIMVSDVAGNQTKRNWHIDRVVEYAANVVDRQLTTEYVTFTMSENGAINVQRDGVTIDKSDKYTDVGSYVITAIDSVGNIVTYNFTILAKTSNNGTIKLYEGQRVLSIKQDGVAVEFADNGDTVVIDGTGRWDISIVDAKTGQSFVIYLNVDSRKPELELVYNSKDNSYSFAPLNKPGVTAQLTKDGKELKWNPALVLKDPGKYLLILSDEFGNINTYEFEIEYKLSVSSIILIVLAIIAVISIIILIIYKRKKVKIA